MTSKLLAAASVIFIFVGNISLAVAEDNTNAPAPTSCPEGQTLQGGKCIKIKTYDFCDSTKTEGCLIREEGTAVMKPKGTSGSLSGTTTKR